MNWQEVFVYDVSAICIVYLLKKQKPKGGLK